MSASHSEVLVDHEGNLSSSKETILQLTFLLLQAALLLKVGILDDLVQGSRYLRFQHLTIREESTMSTSLIHNIASEGEPEQTHSPVLNLIFLHENAEGVGNLSKCRSVIWSLFLINHIILRMNSSYLKWRIPVCRLPDESRCWYGVLIHFLTSGYTSFPVLENTEPSNEENEILSMQQLFFRDVVDSTGAAECSKTSPDVPSKFRV